MTISILISLLLIWLLAFWLWRDYRVDLCRERLFTIRDDLFDMALCGELDFDSPSYGILRSTINGTIQFAHRLTLFEFLAFAIASRGTAGNKTAEGYRNRWEKSCSELPPDTRQKLEAIRGNAHFQVREQIIMTSAILTFTLVSLIFVVALVAIKRQVQTAVKRLFSARRLGKITDSFDSAVFAQAA